MNKSLYLLLVISLVVVGCGKKLSRFFERTPTSISVNEIKFDYLSAKAKIDFEGVKNKISATANFRIQKDSVIWISLSPGLGVEVARIYICPDSISVLDKINRKYIKTDYQELSAKYQYTISYRMIESIILGNLLFPYSREKLQKTDSYYTYIQKQSGAEVKSHIGLKTMKLEKLIASDTATKSSVTVDFKAFQVLEDQLMPFEITSEVLNELTPDENVKIGIYYNKADIEKKPLKFPFNVPQKYERDALK